MFFRLNQMIAANVARAIGASSQVPSYDLVSFAPTDVTRVRKLDWVGKTKEAQIALYREIFEYDTVAGPAIELIANLPFSEFTLVGVDDKAVLDVYMQSLENIKILNLLREIVREMYVVGYVVVSLIFSDSEGVWKDAIVHDPLYIEITPIPVHGFDPKFDFVVPKELKKFLASNDPRDVDARSVIPKAMIEQLQKSKKIPLEPLNTLYVPRKVKPNDIGTSCLKRIAPLYILEKELLIGTIDASKRRQRSILHLSVGIQDVWEPTPEEIQSIAELFLQADSDPQGGIVATRYGVETTEVRTATDFWRVSEEEDFLVAAKLRSLGINEEFLSGSATYSTMEVALSVFIEMLRSLRQEITQRVFYEKLFPVLAKVHEFYERSEADLKHAVRTSKGKKRLLIPRVHWQKQLRPEADADYLNVLDMVAGKGVPVTLRTWASAAGLDLDSLIRNLDEDAKLRELIKKKMPKEEEETGGW